MPMAKCKTAVSQLLTFLRCCSLALNHRCVKWILARGARHQMMMKQQPPQSGLIPKYISVNFYHNPSELVKPGFSETLCFIEYVCDTITLQKNYKMTCLSFRKMVIYVGKCVEHPYLIGKVCEIAACYVLSRIIVYQSLKAIYSILHQTQM